MLRDMPTERSNTVNQRPLKPTLATTRTAKNPVAPRLAPSIAAAGSPQSTRTPRSNAGDTTKSPCSGDLDSTPVKAFINNNNITPRSSARRSRVGIASFTPNPNGTSQSATKPSWPGPTSETGQKEQILSYPNHGLASSQGSQPNYNIMGSPNNSMPPSRNTASVTNARASVQGSLDTRPLFFHASEARTHEQATLPRKTPLFFYANGEEDSNNLRPAVPSPPISSTGRSQVESKFFHADTIGVARATSSMMTPPPLSTSPELLSGSNDMQQSLMIGPPGSASDNMHLSYRKGVSQVLRPPLQTRPSVLSVLSGPHTPDVGQMRSRRASAASTTRVSHGKSASMSSIDSSPVVKKTTAQTLLATPSSPLFNNARILSNGSQPESVSSASADNVEIASTLPSPQATNFAKHTSGQSGLEHMNALAANARRERKVLDLEISNNSLLAINRSLEKELRKQKAELRRFRRMSRAGRFSTDTAMTASSEVPAGDLQGIIELSDMSDAEEEEEASEDEELEDSSESSIDESTMSPTALEKRDAARQTRDERRLQLDLSKHRELLIDSQKMNQSLKRCLTWTEELIKDGQKALTYQVRVSDVQLGGRVLSSDERAEVEHDDVSKGLLSPWTPPQQSLNPFDVLESAAAVAEFGGDESGALSRAGLPSSADSFPASPLDDIA